MHNNDFIAFVHVSSTEWSKHMYNNWSLLNSLPLFFQNSFSYLYTLVPDNETELSPVVARSVYSSHSTKHLRSWNRIKQNKVNTIAVHEINNLTCDCILISGSLRVSLIRIGYYSCLPFKGRGTLASRVKETIIRI